MTAERLGGVLLRVERLPGGRHAYVTVDVTVREALRVRRFGSRARLPVTAVMTDGEIVRHAGSWIGGVLTEIERRATRRSWL